MSKGSSDDGIGGLIGLLILLFAIGIIVGCFTSPGQKLLQKIEIDVRNGARRIKQLVRERKTQKEIRRLVWQLISNIEVSEPIHQIAKLHRFVTDAIGYIYDPWGMEHVSDPVEILSVGAGDCDCKTTLLSTMLEAGGYKSYPIIVKPKVDVNSAKIVRSGHALATTPISIRDLEKVKAYNPSPTILVLNKNGRPVQYLVPLETSGKGVPVAWVSEDIINAIREGRCAVLDSDTMNEIDLDLSIGIYSFS